MSYTTTLETATTTASEGSSGAVIDREPGLLRLRKQCEVHGQEKPYVLMAGKELLKILERIE